MRRAFKILGLAFSFILIVGAILFVLLARTGGGCGGTLMTGRTVGANSDAWSCSATYGRDTATITTAGHTIVVAPTQLLVDGGHYGAIDESVKSVIVTVRDGDISFVADGQPVNRSRR